MGLLSLVLGMVGVCLSWLPYVGVLALFLGIASLFVGLLITTAPQVKETHWLYGIPGLFTAFVTVVLSLVYRQKFAHGQFDSWLVSMDISLSVVVAGSCVAAFLGSMIFARKKNRQAGVAMAVVFFLTLCVVTSWALVELDKTYEYTAKACTIMNV